MKPFVWKCSHSLDVLDLDEVPFDVGIFCSIRLGLVGGLTAWRNMGNPSGGMRIARIWTGS